MKWLISIALTVLSAAPAGARSFTPAGLPAEMQARALSYFVDNFEPATGLVRDRAMNFSPTPDRSDYRIASIAATGFGIAALAHACVTGRYDCTAAQARILTSLTFAFRNLAHYHGWFYHFVNWHTGARFGSSEVSTVDTTWFLAGALYAGQLFPKSRIAELAQAIYERMDFQDMMTNGGHTPQKRTLSMGWMPEFGYLTSEWNSYAEQMMLVLLGLGHPLHPLPVDAWTIWTRPRESLADGSILIGPSLPLFAHQYSHLFVDFRRFHDREGNYFQNSIIATVRDRAFCSHLNSNTFREGFWGLSAGDSPDGYAAFSPVSENGTVCLDCAATSAVFLPKLVLPDMQKWAGGKYRSQIWGKYGFVDSLNLDRGWIDEDVIGITVGALYLALADLEGTHSPWEALETYPPLQRALLLASGARPGLSKSLSLDQ